MILAKIFLWRKICKHMDYLFFAVKNSHIHQNTLKSWVNSLYLWFFVSKVQFSDFLCAATLVLRNFEKHFHKLFFFSKGKEISFLLFRNHWWGPPQHFMMIKKVRLSSKYFRVKRILSEMMLRKSYSTFSHQRLQHFSKVAELKI